MALYVPNASNTHKGLNKIDLHNLVVHRTVSDILLVLGHKKVEKHCSKYRHQSQDFSLSFFQKKTF
jgi:hypothetical protein